MITKDLRYKFNLFYISTPIKAVSGRSCSSSTSLSPWSDLICSLGTTFWTSGVFPQSSLRRLYFLFFCLLAPSSSSCSVLFLLPIFDFLLPADIFLLSLSLLLVSSCSYSCCSPSNWAPTSFFPYFILSYFILLLLNQKVLQIHRCRDTQIHRQTDSSVYRVASQLKMESGPFPPFWKIHFFPILI